MCEQSSNGGSKIMGCGENAVGGSSTGGCAAHLSGQPGLRQFPIAENGVRRNFEHDSGLFGAQAGEESKLDRLGLSGIDLSQPRGRRRYRSSSTKPSRLET